MLLHVARQRANVVHLEWEEKERKIHCASCLRFEWNSAYLNRQSVLGLLQFVVQRVDVGVLRDAEEVFEEAAGEVLSRGPFLVLPLPAQVDEVVKALDIIEDLVAVVVARSLAAARLVPEEAVSVFSQVAEILRSPLDRLTSQSETKLPPQAV